MGYDTTAKVIYGTKISIKTFKSTKTKKRNCNHDIDTSLNFCPVCGKNVFSVYEQNTLYDLPKFEDEYSDIERDFPKLEYKILAFFNEGDKECVIGIEIERLGENEETFSKKLKKYSDEENLKIQKDIIEILKYYKVECEYDKIKYETYLMMHYY